MLRTQPTNPSELARPPLPANMPPVNDAQPPEQLVKFSAPGY
jgi:hypothetical protein